MANGNPKPAFYFAVFLLVVALVGLGMWRFGALPGRKTTMAATEAVAASKRVISRSLRIARGGRTGAILPGSRQGVKEPLRSRRAGEGVREASWAPSISRAAGPFDP